VTAAVAEHVAETAAAVATIVAVIALAWALVALVRGPRRARLAPMLIVVSAGAVLTFVAYIAFALRCPADGCRKVHRTALARIDPWSASMHPWQWASELALASIGLAVAAFALALAARGRRGAWPALWGAQGIYAAWVAVAVLVPALS
jgi:hypothetical protein